MIPVPAETLPEIFPPIPPQVPVLRAAPDAAVR
jgi:hypothetical protein